MDIDTALDQLFQVPLERFTVERNRLSKELAALGDPEAAATVKSLKKPSVSAWAVNQLARRSPQDLEALVGIHERLATSADPAALRAAQDDRKSLIARLRNSVRPILEDGGHPVTAATIQKVSQTLLAASSDDDLESLRLGRLTHDLEPSGFGAMAGFEMAGESKPFKKDDRKAREKAEELDRRAGEAEREATEARRAADEAASLAKRLSKEADRAEERAEEARSAAEIALERLG